MDAKHIVYAALTALVKEGKIKDKALDKAAKELGINPNKRNPMNS